MMSILETLLFMSVVGTLLTGITCALRPLTSSVAAKWSRLLWIFVLIAFLCPLRIPLAILPTAKTPATHENATSEATQQGTLAQQETLENSIPTEQIGSQAAELSVSDLVFLTWLLGAAVMASVYIVRAIHFDRTLKKTCAHLNGAYWILPGSAVPFTTGILRPRIYLPEGLTLEETQCILRHEHAHVRAGDGFIRLGFILAHCVHWFNPVVILADRLCRKDMELACDERAVRGWTMPQKAQYAKVLLSFAKSATKLSTVGTCFTGAPTKERITKIMNSKKPTALLTALCVGACLLAGACAIVHPVASAAETSGGLDTFGVAGTQMPWGATPLPIDQGALVERVADYDSASLTTQDGLLYWDDMPVRYFLDGYVDDLYSDKGRHIVRNAFWNADGTVDVRALRENTSNADGSTTLQGKVLGYITKIVLPEDPVTILDDETTMVLDGRSATTQYSPSDVVEFEMDNLGTAQTTTIVESEEEVAATLRPYEAFGLSYELNSSDLMDLSLFWQEKPVRGLYDTKTGVWVASIDRFDLPKNAISLETVYEDGVLTGLRETELASQAVEETREQNAKAAENTQRDTAEQTVVDAIAHEPRSMDASEQTTTIESSEIPQVTQCTENLWPLSQSEIAEMEKELKQFEPFGITWDEDMRIFLNGTRVNGILQIRPDGSAVMNGYGSTADGAPIALVHTDSLGNITAITPEHEVSWRGGHYSAPSIKKAADQRERQTRAVD